MSRNFGDRVRKYPYPPYWRIHKGLVTEYVAPEYILTNEKSRFTPPIRNVFTRLWVGVEDTDYWDCIWSDYIWCNATIEQLLRLHWQPEVIPYWIPDWTFTDYPARFEHDVRDIEVSSSKLEKLYYLTLLK